MEMKRGQTELTEPDTDCFETHGDEIMLTD